MDPIDHSLTRALLIGASEFPRDTGIHPIPNVVTNLRLLRECLTNPDIVGIPADNISISLNENKLQIERRLHKLAMETQGKEYTILVYYSGHGMLSNMEYRLFLTTADTTREHLDIEGIDTDDFRKYVRRSKAGRKIVILDCCHSGGIIGAMNDPESMILAGIKGFEGTYVMTSAAEDTPSLFPQDQPESPTYFTGSFIDVISSGLVVDNEYCSLRDIFQAIESECIQHTDPRLPLPRQSNYLHADELFFSKNKLYQPRKTPDAQAIEEAWDKAEQLHTVHAYLEYFSNYPGSKYVHLVPERIRQLRSKEATQETLETAPPSPSPKPTPTIKRKRSNSWVGVIITAVIACSATALIIYYSRPKPAHATNGPPTLPDATAQRKTGPLPVENDSKDTLFYSKMGKNYYDHHKYKLAIDYFSLSITNNPKDTFAVFYRGNAHVFLGSYQSALADYNKLIALNPLDSRYYHCRGVAYYDLKKYNLAIVDFSKVITLDSRDPDNYTDRGDALRMNGQTPDACDDYKISTRMGSKEGRARLLEYCRLE